MNDPTQGIEEAALLIGGEPLVTAHLQPPDPTIGGIVDPALQLPVYGDLAAQPQDVETQGEQGQCAPPQPVRTPVGLAVAHDRRADLLQVALGQLLAAELKARRVAVVHREAGLKLAVPHHADGGVRRVLLQDDLLGLDRIVGGQLGQPLAGPPCHLRWGLGAGGDTDLKYPAAIQFDVGRGRGFSRPAQGGRCQQLGRQQSDQQGQEEGHPFGAWAKAPGL